MKSVRFISFVTSVIALCAVHLEFLSAQEEGTNNAAKKICWSEAGNYNLGVGRNFLVTPWSRPDCGLVVYTAEWSDFRKPSLEVEGKWLHKSIEMLRKEMMNAYNENRIYSSIDTNGERILDGCRAWKPEFVVITIQAFQPERVTVDGVIEKIWIGDISHYAIRAEELFNKKCQVDDLVKRCIRDPRGVYSTEIQVGNGGTRIQDHFPIIEKIKKLETLQK